MGEGQLSKKQIQVLGERVRRANEEKTYQRMKKRMEKSINVKFDTAIIGILEILEKNIGFLWGHGKDDVSEDQEAMREIWSIVRSKILDHGNAKKRALLNNTDSIINLPTTQVICIPVDETVFNRGEKNGEKD